MPHNLFRQGQRSHFAGVEAFGFRGRRGIGSGDGDALEVDRARSSRRRAPNAPATPCQAAIVRAPYFSVVDHEVELATHHSQRELLALVRVHARHGARTQRRCLILYIAATCPAARVIEPAEIHAPLTAAAALEASEHTGSTSAV